MTRTNIEPFAMVPRDLIAQVPPRALQVWCCLAQWSDASDHYTRPTINRIAGELGVSRRAIEQALAALEKTGRLVRRSGKAKGQGNEYILILTRLKEGTQKKAYPYAENAAPKNLKVVNQEALTKTPNPQRGNDGLEAWQNFKDNYPKQIPPRQDRWELARAEFERLTPEEQQAALAAARIMATIYAAAAPDRQRYTPHAHKWLKEKRFNIPHEATEKHYNAQGVIQGLRDRQKRAKIGRAHV